MPIVIFLGTEMFTPAETPAMVNVPEIVITTDEEEGSAELPGS